MFPVTIARFVEGFKFSFSYLIQREATNVLTNANTDTQKL